MTKNQELITEIRELSLIETQPFLKELWKKKLQKGGRKILNKKTSWLKNLPQKEEKEKEKNTNKRKIKKQKKKNINKRTHQKHNTATKDIIPTHKQQHIKEKLTLQNTRYIQIGQNIQEQATSKKKNTFQMKNIMRRILL